MLDEETSVLSALRREPDQTRLLIKVSVLAATILVAWDVVAAWALPVVAVKAGLVVLLLVYGATVTHLVSRIMASSRRWASGSAAAATRLASPGVERRAASRGIDLDAVRRRPDELPKRFEVDEEEPATGDLQPAAPATPPLSDSTAFNESYFLMRLKEQVKDARRQGREMCVAAVQITIPRIEMTPDIAQSIAYDMALMAANQARLMSPPLALSDSEFVFSLPTTGPDETKQFVREIVRAFGNYWCYFGIATFPGSAHDAEGLVESARTACEASRQSGKRGQVEYSAA